MLVSEVRDSIVVSIPACHAGDPGSIPGRGVFRVLLFRAMLHSASQAARLLCGAGGREHEHLHFRLNKAEQRSGAVASVLGS